MDQANQSKATGSQDHFDALRSIGAARAMFLLLVVLALLVHIGLYCAVKFGRVTTVAPVEQQPTTTQPITAAQTVATTTAPAKQAERSAAAWRRAIQILIPLSRFVGMVAAVLLGASYFLAVNVCLVGRLGGAGGVTAAFFWSVLLVVLLFPWQHLLAGPGVNVPGAFFSYAEIESVPDLVLEGALGQTAHYARYLGYPILAILIALVASMRFCRAYRIARQSAKPDQPVQSDA